MAKPMKTAPPKAQISQETFDEVVRENVEEFEMSPEEAALEAIAQFESQGVDLSNIIKRVAPSSTTADDDDDDDASRSTPGDELTRLRALIVGLRGEEPLAALEGLTRLLDDVPEMKIIAGRNDAIDPLVDLLVASPSEEVVDRAAALLINLCTENADNQDFVGQRGLEGLATVLAARPEKSERNANASARLLALLRAVCAKHEANKAHFAKAHGVGTLCAYLELAKGDEELSRHLAGALRTLTINDDPKATFSQAQDTIKALVGHELLPYILETLDARRDRPELLSAWLMVLKQLAITEETCKRVLELAGLDLLFRIMLQHARNLSVVKRCITVYRNVAAADELKEYIIASGGAAQILAAMETHRADASLQQHACATLAAIALRSPENSTKLVDLGAARQIALAMRAHASDTAVMRQASLAIRNMVARAPELRARILDEDVEELLREAQRYRGCGDEAYAALRDLGCDIQLSSFGTSTQPRAQFNPVNVESRKLLESVDEAAEAPFALHS